MIGRDYGQTAAFVRMKSAEAHFDLRLWTR